MTSSSSSSSSSSAAAGKADGTAATRVKAAETGAGDTRHDDATTQRLLLRECLDRLVNRLARQLELAVAAAPSLSLSLSLDLSLDAGLAPHSMPHSSSSFPFPQSGQRSHSSMGGMGGIVAFYQAIDLRLRLLPSLFHIVRAHPCYDTLSLTLAR